MRGVSSLPRFERAFREVSMLDERDERLLETMENDQAARLPPLLIVYQRWHGLR
jgi:hypothetical protein